MSNYYGPCFYGNDFVVTSSYIELPCLKHLTERFLYSLNVSHNNTLQYNERISSFKTKNKKLKRLIKSKSPPSSFKVLIVNLSTEKLSGKEQKQLEMGLEFRFIDKNKHFKKDLAAHFETPLYRGSDSFHHQNLEDFHGFFRAYTDISTKKFYATKHFTYKNLKNNIKTDKLVILPRDKDLCVVIMQ